MAWVRSGFTAGSVNLGLESHSVNWLLLREHMNGDCGSRSEGMGEGTASRKTRQLIEPVKKGRPKW